MKDVIYLLFQLLTTIAKLLQPGGRRTFIAENLLLKQQLIIHSRARQRAPNLSAKDRAMLGFWSLFLNPRRVGGELAVYCKIQLARPSPLQMPIQPDALDNPTPGMYPKASQNMIGGDRVNWVGCNWSFCPGWAPFQQSFSNISARMFLGDLIKGLEQ